MSLPVATEDLLALLAHMEAAVLAVDPASLKVRVVGGSTQALLGLPAGVELDPDSFTGGLLHPEDRDALVSAIRAVADDRGMRSLDHRIRLRSRGEVFVRTSLRHSGPEVLAVMQDVSAARHNERQWQELESWLVALGEALPFDFWICDPAGAIALQNPASRRHHGSLGDETGAQPEWKKHWLSTLPRALAGDTVIDEVEYEVEGDRRTFTRVISPIHVRAEVRGAVTVDIDITNLKRTEARLRRSLVELREAQQALVREMRLTALTEMSAVVAHEVRNPLGSIANAAVLLRRRVAQNGQDGELCQIIADEVKRLDQLVTNLLELVRPIRVRLSTRPLNGVVEDALAEVLDKDPAAERIRVIRAFDGASPPVPMDPSLLGMALGKLLRNALQAMPEGGALEVGVRHDPAEGWAQVSIKDSGRGIPSSIQSRLFEPFVTDRATGSGLGLAIVRRIVEAHQGEVSIIVEDRGTVCVVRLPLASPNP